MSEANSHWKGQRVFVTGSTGFLGNAVVEELLAEGAEVVGLVRNRAAAAVLARHQLAGRVHVVHGQCENLFRMHSAMAVHEVRAVFHLATPEENKFDGGVAIAIEAVRRFNPRIPIIVSRPSGLAPVQASPVPLGVARFGELFGPGDLKKGRLVPSAVLAQLAGQWFFPPERGPRDYVFIRDAARACLMLAESLTREQTRHTFEIEFRSNWNFTDRELIAAIRLACLGPFSFAAIAPSLANPLGWRPGRSFAEAIAETVAWYRENADSMRTADPRDLRRSTAA